ncbi:MAG: hypothetical protein ACTSUK_03885 [Promethearchaeota archaeon]
MTELKDILNNNWDTNNVAKPTLMDSPEIGLYLYKNLVLIKPLEKDEDYMGIIDPEFYGAGSADIYEVTVVSTSKNTLIAIVDEIRRICAKFQPTSDEKFMLYETGTYEFRTSYYWRMVFNIRKEKIGTRLVGV